MTLRKIKNKGNSKKIDLETDKLPNGKVQPSKMVFVAVIVGVILGLILLNSNISIDKTTLFQYLQFLLLVCILGLLIDTRHLIKKCAPSKP